jgi:hypothetical protein
VERRHQAEKMAFMDIRLADKALALKTYCRLKFSPQLMTPRATSQSLVEYRGQKRFDVHQRASKAPFTDGLHRMPCFQGAYYASPLRPPLTAF